jgi:peptide/nickel transport system substrate-binding protein
MNIYGVDLTLLMQKVQQDLGASASPSNIQPTANAVWRERVVNPGVPLGARFYAPDYFGSAQYVQFFGMIPGTYWETNASQGKVDACQPAQLPPVRHSHRSFRRRDGGSVSRSRCR